jgi:transcriptional regulator with XRE-family HTH domain
MSNNLAAKILQARLAANLTQAQVAERLGLTRGAITQWESSNPETRTVPSLPKLEQFAQIVNVPLGWLLGSSVPQGLLGTSKSDGDIDRERGIAGLLGPSRHKRSEDSLSGLLGLITQDGPARGPSPSRDDELGSEQGTNALRELDPRKYGLKRPKPGRTGPNLERVRLPRMAENFWRAVEFEVCSERPELAAAFEPDAFNGALKTSVDFLHGENLAEFACASERGLIHPLIRQKLGGMMMAEIAARHPLQKHLLIWVPSEAVDYDLSMLRSASEYLGVHVQLFTRPRDAAGYLLSLE